MYTMRMLLFIVFVCPILILAAIWTFLWIAPASPYIILGVSIWAVYKWKHRKIVIPAHAKTRLPKIKKPPMMMEWRGKKIPVKLFILSMIISLVFTILLILCILFIFPPLMGVLIIGFLIGIAMGKVAKKKSK